MRRDKPRPRTLRLLLAEIYTASASGRSDNLKNPETLGASDSLAAAGPCAGGPPQNRRKLKNLFTMSKIEPGGLGTARNREERWNPLFPGPPSHPGPHSGAKMVEAIGIEPTTFCLQSRCSPN